MRRSLFTSLLTFLCLKVCQPFTLSQFSLRLRNPACFHPSNAVADPIIRQRTFSTERRVASLDTTPSSDVSQTFSDAAEWHRDRRRRMLLKYGDQIAPLEKRANSQTLGLTLLALCNLTLASLSLYCGATESLIQTFLLALLPGSICSLWQLQILHDGLHGSLLDKKASSFTIAGRTIPKKKLQDAILFWGSMPSVFGYYLYLNNGHMSHHTTVGSKQADLKQLFASEQADFEDGDLLFVAHRMKLPGEIGPRFELPGGKDLVMSISRTGFQQWREGQPMWNAATFATSFLFERAMLVINDVVVAVTGRNFFFPNKPDSFHHDCATYCRAAVVIRGALWFLSGSWHSLLFLYLAETLWSISPHPASAMFITNHGSSGAEGIEDASNDECVPSSSTYAGKWYSLLTLGTNYHCEHHDFPTIPLHRLGELRGIAPEFYRKGSPDELGTIMHKTFSSPDFYACMDAGISQKTE
jgi:hypothetical protein